jgi:hypothetical protein
MAKAFELVQTVTVGSGGTSSIDFTSIPDTYTDLLVAYSLRCTLSGGPFNFGDCAVRLNNDTGANYNRFSSRARQGASATFGSTGTFITLYEATAADASANTFGIGQIYIANYTSSRHKSVGIEGGSETQSNTEVQMGLIAGLWKSTSAVTSIKLYEQNGTNFVQNSSASLYGIKKA